MAQKKKLGNIIIPHGIHPEQHELATADVFTASGKYVEFLAPNRSKNSKTPDVIIDGTTWEMKSPTGDSKTTISNALKRAIRQCPNIIIDTRRTKIPDSQTLAEIRRNLQLIRSISKVLLISKDDNIVEIY